jgi:predicted DNA-binding transcriptional regulator YafY
MVILNRRTKGKKMSKATNLRAVILTESEISLLYVALTELRVYSEKELSETIKLKTKLFETVCLPATA